MAPPFLPSKVNLTSGSKLNLPPFEKDAVKLKAGCFKEKVGMIEIPLLVTPIFPAKINGLLVES